MVASSSAIGSLFAVGGHDDEFLMVADEGNIVFYSSKTMLKLRTQRVSDARIVGVNPVVSKHITEGRQYHLHVVDTVGNYFIIDVSTNFIVGSTTMSISTTPKVVGSKPVIGARKRAAVLGGAADVTVQSAQWTVVFDTSDLANEQLSQDGNGELAASTPPDLRVVLLTSDGVYAQYVRHILNSSSTTPYSSVLKFPGPLSSVVMAVGKENGVVLIGQLHRTWLWIASASSLIAKGKALKQITLPARLMSLAVTPEQTTSSFAVGGDRGEIAFYPTANIPIDPTNDRLNRQVDTTDSKHTLRFFSDHWHCTPLQALSFTSDGKALLSAAGERTLLSWSVTGTFTKTKVSSSRREELTEGYLWKTHVEAKIDKKSKYKPVRVKKNGDAESLSFITSDVATIIIPHFHGRLSKSTSPFSEKPPSCFVVGVTGEIAAMDLREQKVTNVADGIRWSLSNDALQTGNKALHQHAEAIEWMGRPAIMIVSPADSEIRIIDPLTQQSLYTHHVRLNMQASIANPVTPFKDAKDSASLEMSDPLSSYFAQNKAAISDGVLRGTTGGLLATVTEGGRLIFTCEDYTHIGLDSVLRVWRYCPEKKRHVEVQSIHNPHTTSVLQMQTAIVKVPKNKQESDSVYENMMLLFTMDRLGVKCWRCVDLPRHENPSAASSDMQRAFLHLGGVGGAKGESEADARLWRVVGTNRCPSGRASRFELSDDGTIIMIADEIIKAYEVPTAELAVAFSYGRKNVGFAVSDWESMFTLTPPTSAENNQASIVSLRFIASSGSLPSVFARFENGSACCWQADQSAQWGLAWSSVSGVHSLLNATSHDGELLLAVVTTDAEKQASPSAATHDVKQVRVVGGSTSGNPTADSTLLATLPQTYGTHIQYVFLPFDSSTAPSSSDGKGANSSALYGRLVCLDLVGLREVRPSFKSSASSPTPSKETIQVFDANVAAAASDTRSDKRIDLFFKRLSAQANATAEEDDDAQTQPQQTSEGEGGVGSLTTTTTTPSSHELLAKVIGSEAYAAPPMGLVLSSLLSLSTTTASSK